VREQRERQARLDEQRGPLRLWFSRN